MRIWSLHPRHLDRAGLIAGWRETLLAQKVLRGLTKGYTRHPQLHRFQATSDPVAYAAAYLHGLADEADVRGYRFDRTRVCLPPADPLPPIPVTDGQLAYEWEHLGAKVAVRAPDWTGVRGLPSPHPLFTVVPGGIEAWERP
ncbi:pyrimidine dimer DNA glycosylase/endonuclease V [Mariniluteicoccus flavus]